MKDRLERRSADIDHRTCGKTCSADPTSTNINMNRHDRRAAAKQQKGTDPQAADIPLQTGQPMPDAPPALATALAGQRKPSFWLKLFSKVLLSRWIVARVQHPQVEQLLISLALESGRPEVADQIVRRQALKRK